MPSEPVTPPTTASADASVSCAPFSDRLGDHGAQVTLATNDLVQETVTVSVIAFDGANQAGSGTVTFGGPMAPGQSFDSTYFPDNGAGPAVTSCEIAEVTVPVGDVLNYDNESPVGG